MTTTDIIKNQMELVKHPLASRPIPAFLVNAPWTVDDDEAQASIVARILAAEDADAVMAKSRTVEFKAYLGTEITIYDFRMRGSDLADGIGAYAVLDVADYAGKREITTTSALQVLAQLVAWHRLDAFPVKCYVLEVELNKKGRSNPVYLSKVK